MANISKGEQVIAAAQIVVEQMPGILRSPPDKLAIALYRNKIERIAKKMDRPASVVAFVLLWESFETMLGEDKETIIELVRELVREHGKIHRNST